MTHMDDEWDAVKDKIMQHVEEYEKDHGEGPNMIYISDNEELQSIMMWVCHQEGWAFQRTDKETYCTWE